MNEDRNKFLILNIVSVIFFFVMWYVLAQFGVVRYLVTPQKVVIELAVEPVNILKHMLATSLRTLAGFAIGSSIGVIIALGMGWSRVILALMNPFISLIKPIPVLALIPIFILWFGLGEWRKILYIAMGCFFIILVGS